MRGKWFLWQAAICGVLLTGCGDGPTDDPDPDPESPTLWSSVNVYNCSTEQIGIHWKRDFEGWEDALGAERGAGHPLGQPEACGEPQNIPFLNGDTYDVRIAKNIGTCSMADGDPAMTPLECHLYAAYKSYASDPNGPVAPKWAVH